MNNGKLYDEAFWTMTVKRIYLALLSLLGLGAFFGGGVLIVSPLVKLLGMPLSILQHSPFSSFLIPGIILFIVLGLVPLLLVFALQKRATNKWAEQFNFYKDMYWAWSYSINIAFALIIWIQVEMAYLQSVHWSHTLYMCWANAIIFVALLPHLRDMYKK